MGMNGAAASGPAVGRSVRFTLDVEHLDLVMVMLMAMAVLNMILAIVLDVRETGFKLVPMWITLMSLCLVSRGQVALALLVGLGLCAISESVCYLDKEWDIKKWKIVQVVFAHLILLVYFCLLASTKVENWTGQREKAVVSHRRLAEEAIKTQETIKAKRLERGQKTTPQEQDSGLLQKRLALELFKLSYQEVFSVRFKRDVPRLLERLLSERMAMTCGVVLEVSEDLKEIRIRNQWGLASTLTNPLSLIAAHKDSALVRRVVDRKETLSADDCRKDLDLLDAHCRFSEELFSLSCVVPILAGERTALVVLLGAQADRCPLPFDLNLIRPILSTLAVVLVRVSTKEARPSFSTFLPGG